MTSPEPDSGLTSRVVERRDLLPEEIDAMWKLYATYYDGTLESLFLSDLAGKSHVLVSRDSEGEIRGFTTIELTRHSFEGREVGVVFSGDTIIDHRFWGKNDFAFCWIRFAASIQEREPDLPLFWLLIVKGHRTYRYLSVFGRRYYPAPKWETPANLQSFMDQLATERFGVAYHPETGLVSFDESHGHLKAAWAEIPESARQRKEVAYFLERNPDYQSGDELVCLCEISPANMKPLTRRVFLNESPHVST